MKVEYRPYTLKGRFGFQSRKGALIHVMFDDGIDGYADVHPWTEMGDVPLSQQLQNLSLGHLTYLTKRSIYFARIDAEARALKKNVFDGLPTPSNYFLIPHASPYDFTHFDKRFECVKIKVGKNTQKELELLKEAAKSYRVRLDFNFRDADISPYLNVCGSQLDYIEDPPKSITTEFTLASDKYSESALNDDQVDVVIIKPAIQSEEAFLKSQKRIVVTSYLDHPLGQLAAAYTAGRMMEKGVRLDICGLASHLVYEKNEFNIEMKGTKLIPPDGTGFGFDHLLKDGWIQI